MGINAVVQRNRATGTQRCRIVKEVPFPPLVTQLSLLFPDGRQTSVILQPVQSLEAKLREVEFRFANH